MGGLPIYYLFLTKDLMKTSIGKDLIGNLFISKDKNSHTSCQRISFTFPSQQKGKESERAREMHLRAIYQMPILKCQII